MSCSQCSPEDCIAPKGWVCKKSGNFYTTGEYVRLTEKYNIYGLSFIQRIDSVKHLLDKDTVEIMKVLLQDDDLSYNTFEALQVLEVLDVILSRLSTDNSTSGSDDL